MTDRLTRLSLLCLLALALALPGAAVATEPPPPGCAAEVQTASPGTGDDEACDDDDGGDAGDDGGSDEGDEAEESDELCASEEGDEGDGEDVEDGEQGDDATGEEDPADDLVDDELDAGPLFRDFCEPPVFSAAFLARRWIAVGAADGYGGGELVFDVDRMPGVPRRWREEAEALDGVAAVALVGRRTAVTRRNGRRVPRRALDRARSVRVEGRLLAPEAWSEDEDGLLVPTFRARSVRIVR